MDGDVKTFVRLDGDGSDAVARAPGDTASRRPKPKLVRWFVIVGLLLALIPDPVYAFYKRAPRTWGPGPLFDQQIAGMTMAFEQAAVFFAVFTTYLFRFLRDERADTNVYDELRATPR